MCLQTTLFCCKPALRRQKGLDIAEKVPFSKQAKSDWVHDGSYYIVGSNSKYCHGYRKVLLARTLKLCRMNEHEDVFVGLCLSCPVVLRFSVLCEVFTGLALQCTRRGSVSCGAGKRVLLAMTAPRATRGRYWPQEHYASCGDTSASGLRG